MVEGESATWSFDFRGARERTVRERLRGADQRYLHPLDRVANAKHQLIRDLVGGGMPEDLVDRLSREVDEIVDFLADEWGD